MFKDINYNLLDSLDITQGEAIKIHNTDFRLIHGDCLTEMDKLIAEGIKVDLVLTDPPYGTTACRWDTIIPFDDMWSRLNKLTDSAVALFGSEPFSSQLRNSNIDNYKYDWIWEKEQGANFMNVKYQPYKVHEVISVFNKHNYYPQMTKGVPYISGKGTSGDITGNVIKTQTKNNGTRYPRSVLRFNTEKYKSVHPTQKPVRLLEYLIKTYTCEGDLVLDFTMGSGSTGVACRNLGRRFIGIELDDDYFSIAKGRIFDSQQVLI